MVHFLLIFISMRVRPAFINAVWIGTGTRYDTKYQYRIYGSTCYISVNAILYSFMVALVIYFNAYYLEVIMYLMMLFSCKVKG